VDFAVAEKDRLYRCLDRVLAHKRDLFLHLQERWKNLFNASFDVLLYDLTSTYVEGEAERNPQAKRGYSRDGRPDCKQVIVALVITPEGFPLAYEVMDGNTSDKTTLRGFLAKSEGLYGQARRVWLMDRGVPTEAVLQEMRATERQFYLGGTPKARVTKYEKQWLELPWKKVRDSVEVKLFSQEGELYVLAKSEGRQQKEIAIRRKKLARLLRKLRRMRKSLPKRDQLLLRIGAAKKEAGRAFGFVKMHVPGKDEEVTAKTFTFHTDKTKLREAQLRDGHYLLRTNLVAEDPAVLWDRYMQLTQIEAAFKCLKSELGIRPILSSARASRGGSHSGGVSGVLPERDLEASHASARPGTDAARGSGKAREHSDARRLLSDYRWPLPDHAALHRTRRGCRAAAASPQADPAESASSPPLRARRAAPGPIENVVQTFGEPLLKTKTFLASNPPNCESWVSSPRIKVYKHFCACGLQILQDSYSTPIAQGQPLSPDKSPDKLHNLLCFQSPGKVCKPLYVGSTPTRASNTLRKNFGPSA
jgi:Transposase DDE domain